jgi:hypothetical protein
MYPVYQSTGNLGDDLLIYQPIADVNSAQGCRKMFLNTQVKRLICLTAMQGFGWILRLFNNAVPTG